MFEDALPILLRGWGTAYLKPGETRTVPFLPSLLRARLEHKPLGLGEGHGSRARPRRSSVKVPAGTFKVDDVDRGGGGRADRRPTSSRRPRPTGSCAGAAIRGEEGVLLGSSRLAYWKLNAPGGEKYLKELGLPVPAR